MMRFAISVSSTLTLTALFGCGGDPSSASLTQNVASAYSECNESEIRFLADKHGVQNAFDACGGNDFSAFNWSPDGRLLYFQLVLSSYVMDANDQTKATMALRVPTAAANAAWLTARRVALPFQGADKPKTLKLAIYDLPITEEGKTTPGQLTEIPLPDLYDVDQLQRSGSPNHIYFTARTTKDGPLGLYDLETGEQKVTQLLPDWTHPIETMTYSAAHDRFLLGGENTVYMVNPSDSEVIHTWTNAKRGTLDPSGRWVALEYAGEERSVFMTQGFDEPDPEDRAAVERQRRAERRAERKEQQIPDAIPTKVNPPMISLVELKSNKRLTLTGFQGDHFQWYEAVEGWASLFVWGYEGRRYRRNVGLVNLRRKLFDIEQALSDEKAPSPLPVGVIAYVEPSAPPADPKSE